MLTLFDLRRGYAHSLDPKNDGVLIVTVDDVDTKNPDPSH